MSKAIRNIYSLKAERPNKVSLVILAAGVPLRMTSFCSRLLVDVEGKTVFNRYVSALSKVTSDYEIVVVGGYAAPSLYESLPSDIIFVRNKDYQTTNNATSLYLGMMAATTKNLLVMYDNVIINENLFSGVDFKESFVISETTSCKKEGIGLTKEKDYLENMSYDMKEKWGGIAYFSGKEYLQLRKNCETIEDRTLAFELINKSLASGGRFKVHARTKQIKNFSSKKDLE